MRLCIQFLLSSVQLRLPVLIAAASSVCVSHSVSSCIALSVASVQTVLSVMIAVVQAAKPYQSTHCVHQSSGTASFCFCCFVLSFCFLVLHSFYSSGERGRPPPPPCFLGGCRAEPPLSVTVRRPLPRRFAGKGSPRCFFSPAGDHSLFVSASHLPASARSFRHVFASACVSGLFGFALAVAVHPCSVALAVMAVIGESAEPEHGSRGTRAGDTPSLQTCTRHEVRVVVLSPVRFALRVFSLGCVWASHG